MELKEPKRKRRVHVAARQPFPVQIESVSGIPVSSALWEVYTGIYNGDCVVVEAQEEMDALYNMVLLGPDLGRSTIVPVLEIYFPLCSTQVFDTPNATKLIKEATEKKDMVGFNMAQLMLEGVEKAMEEEDKTKLH
uniref:Uncharacterized protein n=1 Tax=Timema genevievae TaxID=629358 RepID=A0A7R9JYE0_TIMGE|nr:unnamed protein product [Timema genevievae]